MACGAEGGGTAGTDSRAALQAPDPSFSSSGSSWKDGQCLAANLPYPLSSASSPPGPAPAPTLLLAQVTSAEGGENNELL